MIPENYLICLQLENKQLFFSEKAELTIGRKASSSELALPDDAYISGLHAVIVLREGDWYLIDRHSANGTFLNEKKLTPEEEYPLQVGDRIRLGKTTLIVRALRTYEDVPGYLAAGEPETSRPAREPEAERPVPPAVPPMPPAPSKAAGPRNIPDPIPMTGDEAPMPPASGRIPDPIPTTNACAVPPMPPAPSMAPPIPPAPSMAPPAPASKSMGAAMGAAMAAAAAPMMMSAAASPVKKPGLLSRLFGGKQKSDAPAPAVSAAVPEAAPAPVESSAPAAEPPLDDVQFRGTAPKKLTPGEYFPVKIMMYREDDYQRADRESAMVADETRSASSSVFQAARDQVFRIALQSPDIPLDCETQQLRWNGKFAAADFEVFLPEGFDRKQLRLRGRVYTGDAVLTDLKLILQVEAAQAQQPVCEKVRLRSAFISYASADRAKVVARIQGIQLACPDMDLFFDVESLRRGEHWEGRLYQEIASRDLFYLFWSSNAAASEWVRKELQFAVSRKTLDFIEPIPLEDPAVCAPPESLVSKHFNDWTLRYLSNQ